VGIWVVSRESKHREAILGRFWVFIARRPLGPSISLDRYDRATSWEIGGSNLICSEGQKMCPPCGKFHDVSEFALGKAICIKAFNALRNIKCAAVVVLCSRCCCGFECVQVPMVLSGDSVVAHSGPRPATGSIPGCPCLSDRISVAFRIFVPLGATSRARNLQYQLEFYLG
jgi:hypothetical protein